MRRYPAKWIVGTMALLLACGCAILFVPSDPQPTCTVSSAEFNGWFESGAATLDGVVKPADSVLFPDIPNCSFYKWSWQMFLWLTSPAPSRYGGGGGIILNSPAFFDVSPLDSAGKRTLIPHTSGMIRVFSVRDSQVGPHGLQIVLDKFGHPFEVEPPVLAPNGRQLIRNAAGKNVEIHRAILGKDRRPVFHDRSGKVIRGARPVLRKQVTNSRVIQKFMIKDAAVFLGPAGNVIDVDVGQAGGGRVLMAQNGSLVYYITTVNDVFAYFLTGTKNGGISPAPTQFPTTQTELDAVLAFAATNGKTIVDPEALAIEVKSSWIEASELPDKTDFITIRATVPTYDTSNPNQWVPNGQKTVELALVGMHVVGSTKGHPEMLWATFEHVSSTPNAEYTYRNSGGTNTTVPQDTAGFWLFCSPDSTGPFNQPHMFVDASHNINSIPPFTISPSDTIRWKAWGKAAPGISSNTEVISIADSVRARLDSNDVRRNYIHTGTTWTIFGQPPNNSNQVGTNKLCNTTMETYDQGTDNGVNGMNCFTCHVSNTTFVSHIFPVTKPLF